MLRLNRKIKVAELQTFSSGALSWQAQNRNMLDIQSGVVVDVLYTAAQSNVLLDEPWRNVTYVTKCWQLIHTHMYISFYRMLEMLTTDTHTYVHSFLSHASWSVGGLLLNSTFSTDGLYCDIGIWNIPSNRQQQKWNNTLNRKPWVLFSLGFVEIISLPRTGFLRGVFLANHLATTDFTRITNRQNTYKHKLTYQKMAPINSRIYTKETYAKREDIQSLV